MDLLEPGGRKFVELGSASPPPPLVEDEEVVVVVEEEGADAAIAPETLCQSLHLTKKKKPGHFSFLLIPPQKISPSLWPKREK